jgi:tripartite-type tricarboxylate transporter receptor subunit TctC
MRALHSVTFAAAIAAGVACVTAPGLAQAQQNPSTKPVLSLSKGSGQVFPIKPIRLLVGQPAGSQADTVARMIGAKMSERWGWAVVVDNRPGAGGMLAAAALTKAAPDGHTLLYAGVNFAISAALQPNLPYDPVKDFAGITQIGFGTQSVVVAPSLGVKSVKDLVALAQAQPGKIIFGTPATGGGSHLSGARFNLAVGIKVVHVAFKSGPEATLETVAGRTHYTVVPVVSVLPFTKDGKLLALAVFTPQRSPALPDVPALAETLPEFKRPEATNGLLAPARTPRLILNQISKEVARFLDLPDIKERLQAMGYHLAPSSPEEYDRILREQIETLSRVVRDVGLRTK